MFGRSRVFALLFVVPCALGVGSIARAQSPSGTSASPSGAIGGSSGAPARETLVEKELTDLPEDVRVIPRGPTIPDLQHSASEASIEQTIATVKPKPGALGSSAFDGNLTSHLFEADVEFPIVRQTFYVGGQFCFAAARTPAQRDVHFVPSQPEIFARVVHGGPDEKWAV